MVDFRDAENLLPAPSLSPSHYPSGRLALRLLRGLLKTLGVIPKHPKKFRCKVIEEWRAVTVAA